MKLLSFLGRACGTQSRSPDKVRVDISISSAISNGLNRVDVPVRLL